MDWSKGYSAVYYAAVVDPATWRDIERMEITGGSISRSDSVLQQSADVNFVNYDQSRERYIRIWMDTRQDGGAGHEALFTGLATSPDRDINGVLTTNKVACYSVLKPAQDVLLQKGWYAPAESDGALLAQQLLDVIPAPVEVEEGAPTLTDAIVSENKETRLSMAVKVLKAINWRMRVTGDGTVHICPKATEAVASFDNLENDAIEPRLEVSYDWFACPNVFRATSGSISATVRDDDPDSPLSTINRGREVWKEDSSCKLGSDESVQEYAQRRLLEEQAVTLSMKYDRRFHPAVTVGDIVRVHYPAQKIDGLFRVTSQDIELGYGARTSEEVEAI